MHDDVNNAKGTASAALVPMGAHVQNWVAVGQHKVTKLHVPSEEKVIVDEDESLLNARNAVQVRFNSVTAECGKSVVLVSEKLAMMN